MQATVRKKAKENIFQSAAAIVQDVILEYVDDSEPNPDAPTSSNMEPMANRNRQCLRPEDPKTLEFELDQTNIPEGFFQNDVTVKDRRHLIFSTEKQLTLLSKAKTWYIDSTFHVVKAPFTQLFSVHAFLKGSEGNTKQVPLAYALMSGKSRKDYNKVNINLLIT